MNEFLVRIETALMKSSRKRPWLSKTTGIPISTINGWFSKARMLGADQLFKVAQDSNTTVEYLMTGKEPEQKAKQYPTPLHKRAAEKLETLTVDQLAAVEGYMDGVIHASGAKQEKISFLRG